jgi:RHS repeat-associated protein
MRMTMKISRVALGLATWLLSVQAAWCFYNPQTGRWLSRDSIGETGGRNLYQFVNNAPIIYRDILSSRWD